MQLEVGRRRPVTLAWPKPRFAVSQRVIAMVASAAVGGIAFGVYLTTLAPTVMWYDMGEFATASSTLGIAHNTGYPLLILLGKAFTFLPVGDGDAYRVNLMSAMFTALAVALVFGIIHDLTEDVVASAAGALTLAFASTVWANATWVASYGLNLFFVAMITRLIFAWHRDRTPAALIGAALAFGLALCNHRLIVLVAPGAVVLLAISWRSIDRRTALLATAAFALGLAVYLYLPLRGEQEPALSWARPAEWRTYLSMFLNGQTPSEYWQPNAAWSRVGVLRAYPSYDLTWAGLILAAAGAVVCAAKHRAVAAYLALLVALDAAVVLTYSIHNIYNYLTPAYLALCVLIGIATAQIGVMCRERGWRIAAPLAAAAVLLLPAALVVQNIGRVDRSDDYAAHDFARTTLERLPPRSVVMTDSWTAPPLWYVQLVEGQRRDVFVTPIFSAPGEDAVAFARAQLASGRPVYAAEGLRAPLAPLSEEFALEAVLVDGIETMVTDALPEPRYRDDLVPKASLYRVREMPPDLSVDVVPAAAALDVPFAPGVTLAGFETDGDAARRGSVLRLTYYWRADRSLDAAPTAVTLFAREGAGIDSRHGWPRWQQSREVFAGTLAAGEWRTGAVYREEIFTLVPRDIAPGVYDIRITVIGGGAETGKAAAAAGFVTIGTIAVR